MRKSAQSGALRISPAKRYMHLITGGGGRMYRQFHASWAAMAARAAPGGAASSFLDRRIRQSAPRQRSRG
eukprot:9371767-Pyramimonas_sp.AAC.1